MFLTVIRIKQASDSTRMRTRVNKTLTSEGHVMHMMSHGGFFFNLRWSVGLTLFISLLNCMRTTVKTSARLGQLRILIVMDISPPPPRFFATGLSELETTE